MASESRKNNLKGPRILIVDDDPGQRSLLDSFLKSQGFPTLPVGSGEEALEAVAALAPQVVIMDQRMPGIGGVEASRLLTRRQPKLIVLLVSLRDPDPAPVAACGASA